MKTTDDDLRAELEVSFLENSNTFFVDNWLICNLDCGNRIIGIEKIKSGKTTKIASGGRGLFSIRPFKPVILTGHFTVKWFPFYLLRHHWNLKKDIEDLKLENDKLRRQSSTINQRTEHLESHRLALEKSLNELTEQLNALNQQQFNVNGEKKTLAEIQSLLKVSDDQNSVLKGIEKLSLGKLNYFLRYM